MTGRKYYAMALAFVAGSAWMLYSAAYDPGDGAVRAAKLRAEFATFRRDNSRLKLEVEEMRVLVREVRADTSRLEEVARRRLQMIKKGEIFVLPGGEQ